MYKYISILFIVFCVATPPFSSQTIAPNVTNNQLKIDSLIHQVNVSNDSVKVRCLNNLANEYRIVGELTTAKSYADEGLSIAKKIKWNYGKAQSYNNLAYINMYESDFETAIKNAVSALKIGETTNDKENLGFSYLYLGYIYESLGENKEVLGYYQKSLALRKELGNNYNLGFSYTYLGNYYNTLKNYDSSIYYHSLALQARLIDGDARSIADSYLLIGKAQFKQKLYDQALKNYDSSLKKYELINDKKRLAETYRIFAEAYLFTDNLGVAEHYLTQSLNLSLELGSLDNLIAVYDELANLQEKKGDFEQAYTSLRKHINYKDSIGNNNVYREVTKQILKHKRDKEEKIKQIQYQKEKETQQILILAIASGLGLVVIFLIFVFNRLQITKKQKLVIEQQKEEVESSHHQLKVKNQEITDSINYARRIQSAILPSDKVVKESLKESFILYKPKDIVAGDFYWLEAVKSDESRVMSDENPSPNTHHSQLILFAIADCTGHGVPGAMVSVVCNNALNRSVREHGLTDPGEILDKARDIILHEFEKSEEDVNDGMDIALCSLEGNTLKYAGANIPLWIVRSSRHSALDAKSTSKNEIADQAHNGDFELIEIKPNKQPIGKFEKTQPYTTNTFETIKGDCIYIFSDGFVDQFGGEKGKKFKAKAFRELLLSFQDKSMKEQNKLLNQSFEIWKDKLEQVDDVCIIGVRV